jgi:hypothetical protein
VLSLVWVVLDHAAGPCLAGLAWVEPRPASVRAAAAPPCRGGNRAGWHGVSRLAAARAVAAGGRVAWVGLETMAGRRGRVALACGLLLLAAGCREDVASTTPAVPDRIELPATPWQLLGDQSGQGGLWVLLSDNTLVRLDTVNGRLDGAPVRLPFTPGTMAAGHGALWIVGQVEGRRRTTADGSFPVIQLARVDPRTRTVTAVIGLPLRSNGNRVISTHNAVWVSDPAEATGSRVWRIDPMTNRPMGKPLFGGEEPVELAVHGGWVWSANHDDGTLTRMDPATGAVAAVVELGLEPHGMAVAAGAVWIADAHHHAVLRIDPDSGRVTARVPVDFEPGLLAATDAAVWAVPQPFGAASTEAVVRIDAATGTSTTIRPGGSVTALTAAGESLWAATTNPNTALMLPAR